MRFLPGAMETRLASEIAKSVNKFNFSVRQPPSWIRAKNSAVGSVKIKKQKIENRNDRKVLVFRYLKAKQSLLQVYVPQNIRKIYFLHKISRTHF